jgi:5-methylcytosine-specific restriction enzyme A
VKRTQMVRRATLEAKQSKLARRVPLTATKPLTTAQDLVRGQTKPRPPRNTGPTTGTRKLVMTRADNHCERCGKAITGAYSIHHRKPRGMGGTKDPVANSPSNLVLLCGSATTPGGCHTSVEKFRQAAVTTGWIVARTTDPARVPLKYHSGRWYLLNDDGTLTETVRPVADS